MGKYVWGKSAAKKSAVKPVETKKPWTFLMKSIIILISFIVAEGILILAHHYSDELTLRFDWVVEKLTWVENLLLNYMSAENILLVVLIFFFIYFIKSYIPFLPLSIVCLMTGIIFGKYWWAAFIINLTGLALMFFLRFNSGRVKGENYMQNLLRKSKYVRMAIDVNGISSYSLLAVFRLFPCFPINFVSRLYGANRECKFQWYMLDSLLAVAPRVYVYTKIGRELFNPFSKTFINLLMILVAFSGLGIFITNLVFYIKRRRDEKDAKFVMEKLKFSNEDECEQEAEPYIPYNDDFTSELNKIDSLENESDIAEIQKKLKKKFSE